MKKSITLVLVLCILLVAGYYLATYFADNEKKIEEPSTVQVDQQPTHTGEPIFAWTYNSFEEEEIPRSTIGLVATYPDGTTDTKEIDTVQGGCNDYANPDEDVYTKSTMIICYYAGFGNYYKIVQSDSKYLVKRKMFEEGGEDYNPPQLPFETIAEF